MKAEANEMYALAIEKDVLGKGISYNDLRKLVIDPEWKRMPKHHRQIFRGMAEMTGLSTDQLILTDQPLPVGSISSTSFLTIFPRVLTIGISAKIAPTYPLHFTGLESWQYPLASYRNYNHD